MNTKEKDLLAFLFSRMTWPSLLVREKACTSIADLLIDLEQSNQTMDYLKTWIKSQQLESHITSALLILLRGKMLSSELRLPTYKEMVEITNKPSIISNLLMKELGYDINSTPDWNSMCLPSSPAEFMPSLFFEKYCKSYIPPIYKTHCINIEKKYGLPFYTHWAFEWKTILERINKKPSTEPLNFWGREEYEHYDGIDLQLSEIYRSAYLRTLAWAINKNNFSENDATYFAVKTCPIDPSLWKVQSLSKPQWWPATTPSKCIIDVVVEDIWKKVDTLWQENTKNDWLITQASGRVCQADSIYDLEIKSFFQKSDGNNKPDLETIFREPVYSIPYIATSIGLEGYINYESIEKYIKSLGDWFLLPVTCQVWPYTTPRWQSRRLRRGIWIPAPFLAKDFFEMKCLSDSLNILDGKNIIGKWQDWNWNLREKNYANLTPSTGEYLVIHRPTIEQFIDNEGCCFCWICKITQYYRENSYGDYKTFEHYNEYGTSSIIL